MLTSELLNILVCPACQGELCLTDGGTLLHCQSCRLAFPVRDGIPIMLIDQAVKIP